MGATLASEAGARSALDQPLQRPGFQTALTGGESNGGHSEPCPCALRCRSSRPGTWRASTRRPADWDAACRDLESRLPALSAYRGRLGEGPAILAAFLDAYQAAGVEMGKIALYTRNASSVDSTDQAAAGRVGQANTLMSTLPRRKLRSSTPNSWPSASTGWTIGSRPRPSSAFMAHYVDRLRRRRAARPLERGRGGASRCCPIPSPAPSTSTARSTAAEMRFRPAVAADGDRAGSRAGQLSTA